MQNSNSSIKLYPRLTKPQKLKISIYKKYCCKGFKIERKRIELLSIAYQTIALTIVLPFQIFKTLFTSCSKNMKNIIAKYNCCKSLLLAGEAGYAPTLMESKSIVLLLYDSPIEEIINSILTLISCILITSYTAFFTTFLHSVGKGRFYVFRKTWWRRRDLNSRLQDYDS